MPRREWFHPQRQLQLAVVVLAAVSAAVLAWLAWLLLQQDAALERQRQADRLQQAAETASAALRVAVADLPALAAKGAHGSQEAQESSGPLVHLDLRPGGVELAPGARVLFVPDPGAAESRMRGAQAFDAAEALEFRGDLAGALSAYERAASSGSSATAMATAIARVARVQRKMGRFDAALATYDRLEAMEAARVDRLPAALVARVGRASVFETRKDHERLRDEAARLGRDLLSGHWSLTRAEFEYYAEQAASWAGTRVAPSTDDMVASEAVEWAWSHQRAAREPGYRAIRVPSGAAVVAWSPAGDRVRAVIADGRYLSRFAGAGVADLHWAVRDASGNTIAGDPRVTTAATARVLSDANGDEWVLHIASPAPPASATPRRRLLLLTVALAGIVLAAGWYFVLRGMARERVAGRAQADFVAAVSHEFRSPLTSMSHVAEMLADGRIPEDARERAYEVLVRDTDRLRALVEQLLDFGRFEAGTFALHREHLDISETIRQIVSDFQARVARDGYRVELDSPAEPLWLDADREAMGLAIWNLMDNAVKYSPDTRTIWVALRPQGDRILIDVRDEGLGIPVEEQADVFRQFVRGTEAKSRRIRGTGIGLALVRHVAEAHGGQVTVNSTPGRGSTFTISLPTSRARDDAAGRTAKEHVA